MTKRKSTGLLGECRKDSRRPEKQEEKVFMRERERERERESVCVCARAREGRDRNRRKIYMYLSEFEEAKMVYE